MHAMSNSNREQRAVGPAHSSPKSADAPRATLQSASSINVNASASALGARSDGSSIPCLRALSQLPQRPSPAVNHLKKAVQLRMNPGFLVTSTTHGTGRAPSMHSHGYRQHEGQPVACPAPPGYESHHGQRGSTPFPMQSTRVPAHTSVNLASGTSRAATPSVITFSAESLCPPLPRLNTHGMAAFLQSPITQMPLEQAHSLGLPTSTDGTLYALVPCHLPRDQQQGQPHSRTRKSAAPEGTTPTQLQTQAQGSSFTRPQSVPVVVVQHMQWPGTEPGYPQPNCSTPWCLTDVEGNSSSSPNECLPQMSRQALERQPSMVGATQSGFPNGVSMLRASSDAAARPLTLGRPRALTPSLSAPTRQAAQLYLERAGIQRRCISSMHCQPVSLSPQLYQCDSEDSYKASTSGSVDLSSDDLMQMESSGQDISSGTVSVSQEPLAGPWAVYGKAAAPSPFEDQGPDETHGDTRASDLSHISELSEYEITSTGQSVLLDDSMTDAQHPQPEEAPAAEDGGEHMGYLDEGDTAVKEAEQDGPTNAGDITPRTAARNSNSQGLDEKRQQLGLGSRTRPSGTSGTAATCSQAALGTRCKRHRDFVQGSTQLLQASHGWRRPVLLDPHTGVTLRGQQDIRKALRELEDDFCVGWHTPESRVSSPESGSPEGAKAPCAAPPAVPVLAAPSTPAAQPRFTRTISQGSPHKTFEASAHPRPIRTAPGPTQGCYKPDCCAPIAACVDNNRSGTASTDDPPEVLESPAEPSHGTSHSLVKGSRFDSDPKPAAKQAEMNAHEQGTAEPSNSVRAAQLWSKQDVAPSAWQRLRSVPSATQALPPPGSQDAANASRLTSNRGVLHTSPDRQHQAPALHNKLSKSMSSSASHGAFLRVVPDLKTRVVLVVGLGHASALARSSSSPVMKSVPVFNSRTTNVNDLSVEAITRSPRA